MKIRRIVAIMFWKNLNFSTVWMGETVCSGWLVLTRTRHSCTWVLVSDVYGIFDGVVCKLITWFVMAGPGRISS